MSTLCVRLTVSTYRRKVMNILILNGNPDINKSEYESTIGKIREKLIKNNQVNYITVRDVEIKKCIGCLRCWIKTPGYCLLKDDMEKIYQMYMNADLVIFSSPVYCGYTSSILKKLQDRLCPLIHPYSFISEGVLQHEPRYSSYPDYAVLVDDQLDNEEFEILTDLYRKSAISFSSEFAFSKTSSNNIEEIIHEINSYK